MNYSEIEKKYTKSLSQKLIVEIILGVISLVGAALVTFLPDKDEQQKIPKFLAIILAISFLLIVIAVVVVVEVRYSRYKKIYEQESKKQH